MMHRTDSDADLRPLTAEHRLRVFRDRLRVAVPDHQERQAMRRGGRRLLSRLQGRWLSRRVVGLLPAPGGDS